MIRTVCGDISGNSMGFCDTHSHVFQVSEHLLKSFDDYVFACDNFLQMCEELELYKNAGGGTLVDAQPIGTGRRALMLQQASEKTGVNIIASTGSHQRCFYPDSHWIFEYSADELAEIYVHEINIGMYDYCESCKPAFQTDVKAGQIKIATQSKVLDGNHKKLVQAAAVASNATGAPIMIHTENESAETTIELLMKSDVPARKIILAHTDRYHNLPPKSFDIASQYGVWMTFDTFSDINYSEAEKIDAMKEQLALGRVDHLLLGLDPTRPLIKTFNGRLGFEYLPGKFAKALAASGVSEEDILKITVKNPAKAWDMD